MDNNLYYTWLNGDLKLPFDMYLVGGAVRDRLLGKVPKDLDFVVVGATLESFKATFPKAHMVGKDFPVFLVPGLGEVAFARRERKVGPYHSSFEVDSGQDVTLEQDLERRDLTMNAMAMAQDQTFVDPFGGASDLELKVLRHVGAAFSEDSLRVFRLARFAAQLNFVVATDTMRVARKVSMVDLSLLPAERVAEEFRKAMKAPYARRFVEELERMGVLSLHFPELARLRQVPAGPVTHHPEGDALEHTLMSLDQVTRRTEVLESAVAEELAVAVLFHDLGKGVTPVEKWPSHPGHDEAGVPLVEAACARLKLPTAMTKASVMVCREHMRVHAFLAMRKGKMVDLVVAADRTTLKAEGLAQASLCDCYGRGLPHHELVESGKAAVALRYAAPFCRAEKGHPLPPSLVGPAVGLHVRSQKGNAVQKALKDKGLL